MHSWLPDAHSQAPAPVSGLMSGVLLSVALYVILRLQVVADLAIGTDLIRWMLAVGGVASLLVASLLLLRQRDYKRMLAYSRPASSTWESWRSARLRVGRSA